MWAWAEPRRASIADGRSLRLHAQFLQRIRCLFHPRTQLERLPVVRDRPVLVTAVCPRDAAVIESGRVVRIVLQRLVVIGDRVLVVLLVAVCKPRRLATAMLFLQVRARVGWNRPPHMKIPASRPLAQSSRAIRLVATRP